MFDFTREHNLHCSHFKMNINMWAMCTCSVSHKDRLILNIYFVMYSVYYGYLAYTVKSSKQKGQLSCWGFQCWSTLFIFRRIYTSVLEGCKRTVSLVSFEWVSMLRWQCLIHNGNLYLINNVGDILVYLWFSVFNLIIPMCFPAVFFF